MESGRNLVKQVLELVGNIMAGVIPGTVSPQFAGFVVFVQLLCRPLLDDPTDLPAFRIVFDADADVAETFPVQEVNALIGKFAGLVEDVLGFGKADGLIISLHVDVDFND